MAGTGQLASLDDIGAIHLPGVADVGSWLKVLSVLPSGRPGIRLSGIVGLSGLIAEGSAVHLAVSGYSKKPLRPVRLVYFDKGADNNWSLGWHQDRTIAVAAKASLPGFEVWTIKQGIPHVEPPMAIIEGMLTVRVHLDSVDQDNAPLRIVPGSHRLGRISDVACNRLALDKGEFECHAKAGDLWLYRTAIVHASNQAAKPTRRRVVQIDYSGDELPHPLQWFGI